MEKKFLDILRPDDWHVHLREGEVLSSVLPFTYENFGSALIMPNLDTPITNISLAENMYCLYALLAFEIRYFCLSLDV